MKFSKQTRSLANAHGFTLMELMVATTILAILTMMALPLARVTIQREKEKQLRQDLWEMRDAIDRYKDAADRQVFQTKVDSGGYPPDLETLVKGVEGQAGKKYRFLRSILSALRFQPQMETAGRVSGHPDCKPGPGIYPRLVAGYTGLNPVSAGGAASQSAT